MFDVLDVKKRNCACMKTLICTSVCPIVGFEEVVKGCFLVSGPG